MMNETEARKVIDFNKRQNIAENPQFQFFPAHCEAAGDEAQKKGELILAAAWYDVAAGSSLGHKRMDRYREHADKLRSEAKTSAERHTRIVKRLTSSGLY